VTTDLDDDLRVRLARLDPMPSSIPVDPSTSPRALELLERIMLTTEQSPDAAEVAPLWRKPAALVAVAAAVLAIGVGTVLSTGGGGHSTKVTPPSTMALKAPGGGISMGSCIRFSVDILKGMPLAFGGTVTDVSPGTVSLSVDRWFKGGTADVVTVSTPPSNTSVGTVELVKGKRYLVTATDGVVNSCGYTGEATPELEKSFEQAFKP
jgi:hypothetical protein